jgi:hypothetical protein
MLFETARSDSTECADRSRSLRDTEPEPPDRKGVFFELQDQDFSPSRNQQAAAGFGGTISERPSGLRNGFGS